jgi:hypothetical protein
MNQPAAHQSDPHGTEALFRRVMARATDQIWSRRLDDEALSALYGVLSRGSRRKHIDETSSDDLPQ